MNLVLLQSDEVPADGRVCLTGPRADHIVRVLGVAPGRGIRVGIVNGSRGTGTVESAVDSEVRLACRFETSPPERPATALILALPRPKVLKRLWAQLAAIGLRRIVLTHAEKVERTYFDTHWLDPRYYGPLLLEGLSQAGDTFLPEVRVERRLKPFLEDRLAPLFPDSLRLIAHPRGGMPLAAAPVRPGQPALLAIGPEGGWTDDERDLFGAHGFLAVNLGARTLRTDTACIALLGALNALLGARSAMLFDVPHA